MKLTAEDFKYHTYRINILSCARFTIEAEIDFYQNVIFYHVVESEQGVLDGKTTMLESKYYTCKDLKDAFNLINRIQIKENKE